MPEDTPGRTITVLVQDQLGKPVAGAEVAIRVDGRPRGLIHMGNGADTATISIASTEAPVELELRSGAVFQQFVLAPGQTSHQFRVEVRPGAGLVRQAKIPAVARCPDGTTDSPCVTCREDGETWTICVS